MNQTSAARFMPSVARKAPRAPRFMPAATAKRIAGPGIMATAVITARKLTYLSAETGQIILSDDSRRGTAAERRDGHTAQAIEPTSDPT